MSSAVKKQYEILSQSTATLVNAAVEAAETREDATYFAIGGVSGALTLLAHTLGNDPATAADPDVTLFAALLVTEVARPRGTGPDVAPGMATVGMTVEFTPEAVYRALTAFEKLTGRKVDDKLTKGLVDPVREKHGHGSERAVPSTFLN